MRLGWILAGIFLVVGTPVSGHPGDPYVQSLAGKWRFALDRHDSGIPGKWYDRPLPDRVRLPGSLPGQGLGDPIRVDTSWTGSTQNSPWFKAPEYAPYRQPGHIKIPFWLQPETYYRGAAWYQRDIEIPARSAGRRAVLFLERPHWETRVWVNDIPIGTNQGLSTPHEYDLGLLAPGKYRLTVRVDNRMVVPVGVDSHSVSDHTQGNWNGMVGRLELQSTPPVWIDDLQAWPDLASHVLRVTGRLGNLTRQAGKDQLKIQVQLQSTVAGAVPFTPVEQTVPVTWEAAGGEFSASLAMPAGTPSWDEFHPRLFRLMAALEGNGSRRSVAFGWREFSTRGTRFTINGRPTFLRGTLECCIFPRTGHPPTDLSSWQRIFRIAKAHGLNNIRFHSWCPPEAAFQAADEAGFYLHVECSSWANDASTTLGDGLPVDRWIYEEAERILRCFGNHPSFVLMPYGNEPGGKNCNAFLARWVAWCRQRDPRRLYTSGAGWPQLPENQFHVTPDPRIQGWGQGLQSRINARPPETVTDYRDYVQAREVPVISHEIGQWCVYPNFAEIPKYTGYLKPKNFEIFQDRLRANHQLDLAPRFLMASGKLQALCYKEDIESALRTPGMGGFQLLDLHDFPGQGTALVGVLDPFWDSKGYIPVEEFRQFCGPTVPLALLSKRVFTADETLTARVRIAHYGPEALTGTEITWRLSAENGTAMMAGSLGRQDIPLGSLHDAGKLQIPLTIVKQPSRLALEVALAGTPIHNRWDIWVFPPAAPAVVPPGVTVTSNFSAAADALQNGGAVLFLPPPDALRGDKLGKVELGFSSIFWNTAWTGRQPPHTLGILCDPAHPALRGFPTEYHSNWQWWYLVSMAGAMLLDRFPPELRPVVQVIDDWVTARRLGLLVEARVGRGRLLICSIDLGGDLSGNPVARQFRQSLLEYLASPQFSPPVAGTLEQVRSVLAAGEAK